MYIYIRKEKQGVSLKRQTIVEVIMEKSQVRVGWKYRKVCGAVASEISIVEKLEDGTFTCSYKSGKTFKASRETICSWERIVKAKPEHKRRINQPVLVDACKTALNAEKRWLTPTELVKQLVEKGLYKFTEKAKTPHCTVSSRLNTYLREGGKGIQKFGRGHFAAEGVEPPVATPAEA